MNTTALLCIAALAIPAAAQAYEKAFAPTKPGALEVKIIPERTLIVAQQEGRYFDENNRLFRDLFRYIKDNDVSMTVPVKADIDPGKMYFYIGDGDLEKELKDTDAVKVVMVPETKVMSMGVRGSYSEKNFRQARDKLAGHLEASEEWKQSGDAYAIYWNGPFVPGFMKRFEVHVPIEPVPKKKKKEKSE
ncbi:MAG: hypothetical protein HKP10_02325 [Kiritimatiellales bacterium]|nr:hypothetical protein [Kiritimatiellales bacterium]